MLIRRASPRSQLLIRRQIAKQKSQGEENIRNARKRRVEKIQKKMNECQRKQQEKSWVLQSPIPAYLSSFPFELTRSSRDALRPKVDRLRELLERKRSLEAKQDEHFQQVTSAMTATVQQLNVAIRDRCEQLVERD